MKLLFRQRAFSWFDSYDIYDENENTVYVVKGCLLYTSPSPRDRTRSRMPSSA